MSEELEACVRCSHRAFVRLKLRSGATLDFCAHHAQQHEVAIVEHGGSILVDLREALYTKA